MTRPRYSNAEGFRIEGWPPAERDEKRAVALMVAIAVAVCVLVAAIVVNTPAVPTTRLTCPPGYALVDGVFQKAVCAPGYVEPVRR